MKPNGLKIFAILLGIIYFYVNLPVHAVQEKDKVSVFESSPSYSEIFKNAQAKSSTNEKSETPQTWNSDESNQATYSKPIMDSSYVESKSEEIPVKKMNMFGKKNSDNMSTYNKGQSNDDSKYMFGSDSFLENQAGFDDSFSLLQENYDGWNIPKHANKMNTQGEDEDMSFMEGEDEEDEEEMSYNDGADGDSSFIEGGEDDDMNFLEGEDDMSFMEGEDDMSFMEGENDDMSFMEGENDDMSFMEGENDDMSFMEGEDDEMSFMEGGEDDEMSFMENDMDDEEEEYADYSEAGDNSANSFNDAEASFEEAEDAEEDEYASEEPDEESAQDSDNSSFK